jgi:excisionase family DNA binding protein
VCVISCYPDMNPEEKAALYVRIPRSKAEKLDRAAFALGVSKQDLVAGLVGKYVRPESARGLEELEAVASPRRTTTVESEESLVVGRASFRPDEPREVMSLAELAKWLDVEEETVRALAEAGELPGRRLGEEWRFARAAVLDWLAAR